MPYEDWSAVTRQRIPRSMVFAGSDIQCYAFYRHGIGFFTTIRHAIQVDGNVMDNSLTLVHKTCNSLPKWKVSQLNTFFCRTPELIILFPYPSNSSCNIPSHDHKAISKLEQLTFASDIPWSSFYRRCPTLPYSKIWHLVIGRCLSDSIPSKEVSSTSQPHLSG